MVHIFMNQPFTFFTQHAFHRHAFNVRSLALVAVRVTCIDLTPRLSHKRPDSGIDCVQFIGHFSHAFLWLQNRYPFLRDRYIRQLLVQNNGHLFPTYQQILRALPNLDNRSKFCFLLTLHGAAREDISSFGVFNVHCPCCHVVKCSFFHYCETIFV